MAPQSSSIPSNAPTANLVHDFIEKWSPGGSNHGFSEKAGAQQHFIELCAVLGVPTPDHQSDYTFELATIKLGGDLGFADVFKRQAFGWENKAPGGDLKAALKQLKMYASALDNPPLLIVSDRLRIQIHTQFTGTPTVSEEIWLKDLADPAVRERLRKCWTDPDFFKPKLTSRDITQKAADAFASVAERMREERHIAPERVSHFLTQCLFCFFAEDVGLLPEKLFDRLVSKQMLPEKLRASLIELFGKMRDGGLFGVDDIPWFNGGLFKTIDVPELTPMDISALRNAATENWSAIDVSIFGTLFERGLNPKKRSQLGAHYTDSKTIMRVIEPVVQRPLLAEWAEVKALIQKDINRAINLKDDSAAKKARRQAEAHFQTWLERLKNYRLLDPACGSGNFLYLGLKTLKDIELQTHIEAESLGVQRPVDMVTSPANVLGIELDEYAAELARVTVWIGELQWCLQHGYNFKQNPVLEPLDHIENRDALLAPFLVEGRQARTEATWPRADAVIGNPPFVGGSKKRRELGDETFEALAKVYAGRVPPGADLVCYWFDKARAAMVSGNLKHAGLVSTNSIRGGANRKVLDAIVKNGVIFDAWSDEPWVNDGAAVRVSLIAFCRDLNGLDTSLNGNSIELIAPDLEGLSSSNSAPIDVTTAKSLHENLGASFQGSQKIGPFDIDGNLARAMLRIPNPNGRSNSEVVKPSWNGLDLTRKPRDGWIIDFGTTMTSDDAALFETPFRYVENHVKPIRLGSKDGNIGELWWLHGRPRRELRARLSVINFYLAISAHTRHHIFARLPSSILPDKALIVVPRADHATFGLLQCRMHELWALRKGTSVGVGNDPRYTPTTCFETFPFPFGLTPRDTAHQRTETLADGAVIPLLSAAPVAATRDHAINIARAAKRLNDLREGWLNPPAWTERVPEVTPLGMDASPYPDRIVPKASVSADDLKALSKRTLTNLYNERPTWLANGHAALDAAVAAAYGWTDYSAATTDDEILARLLALNLERAKTTI